MIAPVKMERMMEFCIEAPEALKRECRRRRRAGVLAVALMLGGISFLSYAAGGAYVLAFIAGACLLRVCQAIDRAAADRVRAATEKAATDYLWNHFSNGPNGGGA